MFGMVFLDDSLKILANQLIWKKFNKHILTTFLKCVCPRSLKSCVLAKDSLRNICTRVFRPSESYAPWWSMKVSDWIDLSIDWIPWGSNHRTSGDDWGVHLPNARYLASIAILARWLDPKGIDWIELSWIEFLNVSLDGEGLGVCLEGLFVCFIFQFHQPIERTLDWMEASLAELHMVFCWWYCCLSPLLISFPASLFQRMYPP